MNSNLNENDCQQRSHLGGVVVKNLPISDDAGHIGLRRAVLPASPGIVVVVGDAQPVAICRCQNTCRRRQ